MSRRTRMVLISVAVVVVLAAGAYGIFALTTGGGPAPVALPSTAAVAAPTLDEATGSGSIGETDGTWSIDPDESFVGYRVTEKLAMLPAPSEAVGRTSAVEGEIELDGLEAVQAEVDAADNRDIVRASLRHQLAAGFTTASGAVQRSTSRGPSKTRTASTRSVAARGRVVNTERLPSPIANARRKCCSESGPRIRPSTAGTSGKSYARIAQPSAPTAYIKTRSSIERFKVYVPSDASTRTPPKSSGTVSELRALRRMPADGRLIAISAADPLNLAGIVTAGPRVPAHAANRLVYRDGVPLATGAEARVHCPSSKMSGPAKYRRGFRRAWSPGTCSQRS